MINFFKKWYKKAKLPHVCVFKLRGMASHFGQCSELDPSKFPYSYHFPPSEIISDWIKQGFNHASVYQSQWHCDCGKHDTYFFLDFPFDKNKNKKDRVTINIASHGKLNEFNPYQLKSFRGISIKELTDELIEKLC